MSEDDNNDNGSETARLTDVELAYQERLAADYQQDLEAFGPPETENVQSSPIVFRDIDEDEAELRHRRAEQTNQKYQAEHHEEPAADNVGARRDRETADLERANIEEAMAIASSQGAGDRDDYIPTDHNGLTEVERRAAENDMEQARRATIARRVVNRYVVDGNLYKHRDGKLAFKDNGRTITSRHEDEQTTGDQVDLMASRGVTSIKVKGTKVYTRNAWIAGQRHGMEVEGYKPTAQDLALFQKPENVMSENAQKAIPEQSASISTTPAPSTQRQTQPGEISGELLSYGAARYQHHPKKKMSYYVIVSTPDGTEKTQWGVDLRKAVADSGVENGDKVTLRKVDAKPVTVEDENGVIVESKRATWVIDAPERAKIIAAKHEQNKATVIKAAGAVVAGRVPDITDRDAINEMIAQETDKRVDRGEPLPEVPIYQTERQAPIQREQDEERLQHTPT